MELQLSPREAQLYELFRRGRKQPIAALARVYQDTYAPGVALRVLAKNVTSVIVVLNRKLKAARKGRVVRISPRGRGHAGIYQLKRK